MRAPERELGKGRESGVGAGQPRRTSVGDRIAGEVYVCDAGILGWPQGGIGFQAQLHTTISRSMIAIS